MDLFQRIGNLASFLDDELHRIEASYRIILESSRRYDGPAEIAGDVLSEIQDLNHIIDNLISSAKTQHEHFEGFLKSMTETIEKFDEKIGKVETYASSYGYIKSSKEKIDLRSSLEGVENKILEASKVTLDSPNILHIPGISKQTLQNFGYTLGKDKNVQDQAKSNKIDKNEGVDRATANQTEKENIINSLADSEGDSQSPSPPISILKKKLKMNASSFDHSQVEISPGLFVKRPSSRSKNECKSEVLKPVLDADKLQSSVLTNLNDVDIYKKQSPVAISKKVPEFRANDCVSPELPKLRTIDLAKIIEDNKNIKANCAYPYTNSEEAITPEIPNFQSEYGKILSAKKTYQEKSQKSVPVIEASHEEIEEPELPDLKTVNLAKLLLNDPNKNVSSNTTNSTNAEDVTTPEMPNFQSEYGKLLSAKKTYFEKNQDDEQDKENTHSTPELPLLNSYEANAVLSQKKLHKSPSPMKFQENNETIDQESPQLPNLKTINLESLLRGKGTLL